MSPDEKPDEETIQDDAALMKYLEDLQRKRAEKLLKSNG